LDRLGRRHQVREEESRLKPYDSAKFSPPGEESQDVFARFSLKAKRRREGKRGRQTQGDRTSHRGRRGLTLRFATLNQNRTFGFEESSLPVKVLNENLAAPSVTVL
jgi:hypothetical protein